MSHAEREAMKADLRTRCAQQRRVAHRLAAVDRQILSRFIRRDEPCPVERMHFVNARAAWRATHPKGGAK